METGTPQPFQGPPEKISWRRRLPFRITLLLTLVLIPTVLNAVRFFTAITWNRTLGTYMSTPLVAYVAMTGAVWAGAGCFVLWNFFRSRWRVGLVILLGAAAYALWVWIDRFLLQPGVNGDWAFDLVVTVTLLAYVAAVVLDPHNRPYFRRESYER